MISLGTFLTLYSKLPESLRDITKACIPNKAMKNVYINYRRAIADSKNCFNLPLEQVRIEVSSLCNLRCKHCASGAQYESTNREIMTPAIFKLLLEQLKGIDTLKDAVLYLGGEPLLNNNLPSFISQLHEETSINHTRFNTNGMLLKEEISRRLLDADLGRIAVSIDGNSPQESEQIRIGSNYNTIKNNIYNFIKLAEGYKTTIEIVNIQIPCSEDELLRCEPEAPLFLTNDFGAEMIEPNYAMKWPGQSEQSLIDNGFKTITIDNQKDNCIHTLREMSLRSNGDCVLCCYDITGMMVIDNIQNNTVSNIWNSAEYQKIRKAIMNRDINNLPNICKGCRIFTNEKIIRC